MDETFDSNMFWNYLREFAEFFRVLKLSQNVNSINSIFPDFQELLPSLKRIDEKIKD